MKKHLTFLIVMACLSFGTASVHAGPYRSEVIGSDGSAKEIQLPSGKMMVVLNFAQPASAGSRGSLTVTKPGSPPVQVRYAIDLNTSTVEPASRETYIPGPATVTATPSGGYLLYLTYKLMGN